MKTIKGNIITITTTREYEITGVSPRPLSSQYKNYVEARHRANMKVSKACYICDKLFRLDDPVYLCFIKGQKNELCCQNHSNLLEKKS
jgi:hypothetical protein